MARSYIIGRMYMATVEQNICDAIEADKFLEFDYNGCHRVVKPFVVIKSKSGKSSVIGVQTGGKSESGEMPFWRTFNLEDIDSIDIVEGPEPAHGSDRIMPHKEEKYNPNDKRYAEVVCARDGNDY
jgi:hypothetical protein